MGRGVTCDLHLLSNRNAYSSDRVGNRYPSNLFDRKLMLFILVKVYFTL